jgi:hypothetical protein
MLFGEIIAVYPEKHAKHINISCEQNTELLIVTTMLERVRGNLFGVWESHL